jgi:hypothetical protein
LNAPGNSAPHAATEMNFGLPSAASGRLARHGRPGPGATYLRTAINTCGIALPCGDRNEFRSTCRRGAGADAGCGRVRRNSFRHGLGEDKGRPRGCAEIHFGMGWGRTRGDRNKFRSTCRRGAGADAGRAKGCAEIHFGMGWGRTRGDRNKFRSTGRRGAGADAGRGRVRRNSFRHGLGEDKEATEINFGQRAGAGQGRTRGAAGCAEIHFGMGWGRTRGDREGAPKFISAWVVSRSGVTEINFGHRAGAGRGRTRGAAGFAEIHFGMGWGRTWGERKGAPKFIMGWGRTWGERKGAPKFISAWVVSRSGVTEINFGQRAGAGCRGGNGARQGAPKFISAWVVSRSDRNEFRSTGRRGLRAEMGCGRVRRNSLWVGGGHGATERVRRNLFRHGLWAEAG